MRSGVAMAVVEMVRLVDATAPFKFSTCPYYRKALPRSLPEFFVLTNFIAYFST